MKTTLLLLTVIISGGLNAQNESSAIRQWQSLHPTTLLISSGRFNMLSDAERELLGKDYILFNEEISLEQLQQYDAAKSSAAGSAFVGKDEDAAVIKQWKGTHQDVKLVPRAYFESLTGEQQLLYTENPYCLILLGETLTVEDIEHFEAH
jgi:hypothetical protein